MKIIKRSNQKFKVIDENAGIIIGRENCDIEIGIDEETNTINVYSSKHITEDPSKTDNFCDLFTEDVEDEEVSDEDFQKAVMAKIEEGEKKEKEFNDYNGFVHA